MLVVDASCLYEVLVDGVGAEAVRTNVAEDPELAAPHIIDVEVVGVLRRDRMLGRLDATAAAQALDDLRTWPADRYGHRALLDRAWELRDQVRTWDAMYIALAEALDATVVTLDRRLASVSGLRCSIQVPMG